MNTAFLFELLLFISVLVAVGICWRVHVRHMFDAVALYTYLFTLIYLVRAFFLLTGLDVPYPEELMPSYMENERNKTLLLTFTWVIGFSLAALARPIGNAVGNIFIRPPKIGEGSSGPHPMAFLIVCFGLFALSILVALIPITKFGFNIAAITHAVRIDKLFGGIFFVVNIAAICGYFCSAFVFTAIQQQRAGRWHVNNTLLYTVFFMGFIAVLTTILYGDRDQVMFYFVFTVLGFSLFVKKLPMLALGVFGAFSVWGLSFMQVMRLKLWGHDLEFDSIIRQFSAALNMDFYDKTLLMLYHYPTGGFRAGQDYALGFLGVIPRSIWQNKPQFVDPGAWFRSQFYPEQSSGWPLTITAEWFMNFSWFGVLAGGLISGILYTGINSRYRDFTTNPLAFMLLFILAIRVFPLGYKATVPQYIILWWIPIIVCMVFLRIFSQRVQNR